ncbi:MAG: hypothetical protein IPM82_18600 [Saprospiraceae bacterium]|nr:hypothetical protein [Saprospiraceae bacterium]
MSTADQIRNKIADGDLEESLDLAISFLLGRDPGLHSECLQHKGRLNDHNRQYRLKIISVDTIDMTRAQVRSALIDVILRRIEELSGTAANTFVPPFEPARQQTVTLNFGQNTQAGQPTGYGPFVPTDAPASSLANHAAARQLVEEFVKLLATYEVENAAWRAAPFLHRSLLQGEMMQPQFKQNNFYSAHQRFRSYKMPVSFIKTQSTNRTAIGGLRDRDEGEEFVYTLEKMVDNGGMPGTVRVFFPKNGGGPKITLVSL